MLSLLVRGAMSRRFVMPKNHRHHNLIRDLNCRGMKEGPDYRVRTALPHDYDPIISFLGQTYVKNEPSIVNINLPPSAHPMILDNLRKHVSQGLTLVCETENGAIAGVAVNQDLRPGNLNPPGHHTRNCTCDCIELAQLLDFYEYVTRAPDLWRIYCVDSVFECSHVAVSLDHQGKGIAKRLVQESWLLARDLTAKLFRIDCSSKYTARIAQNFGWQCVYTLPYKNYCANGEQIFKHVKEPHDELLVYVDKIDYCDGYLPSGAR